MAPSLDISDWWAKETQKGTPVIVTMENPNYSVVEINSPNAAFQQVDKDRGKKAKEGQTVYLMFLIVSVGVPSELHPSILALA